MWVPGWLCASIVQSFLTRDLYCLLSFIAAPLVEADEEVEIRYYELWRLEQGVPEGPREIHHGKHWLVQLHLQAC